MYIMHACMHVCMYVCMHVCMHVRMFSCMHYACFLTGALLLKLADLVEQHADELALMESRDNGTVGMSSQLSTIMSKIYLIFFVALAISLVTNSIISK